MVGGSRSVVTFSEQLMPNARAIVATRMPFNLPWQRSGGQGATGDIVSVWYAKTA